MYIGFYVQTTTFYCILRIQQKTVKMELETLHFGYEFNAKLTCNSTFFKQAKTAIIKDEHQSHCFVFPAITQHVTRPTN